VTTTSLGAIYDGRGNLTHQTPGPSSPAEGEIRYILRRQQDEAYT
jgi:hypothetical protein